MQTVKKKQSLTFSIILLFILCCCLTHYWKVLCEIFVIIKLNHLSEIKYLYDSCRLDKDEYLLEIFEISNA